MEHSGDTASKFTCLPHGLNQAGLTFQDLFTRSGLERLDQAFLAYLRQNDAALAIRLLECRQLAVQQQLVYDTLHTELLLALARRFEHFCLQLFDCTAAGASWSQQMIEGRQWLYAFQRNYMTARVRRRSLQVPSLADVTCVTTLINALADSDSSLDATNEPLQVAKAAVTVLSWYQACLGKEELTQEQQQVQHQVLPLALAAYQDTPWPLEQPAERKAALERCLLAQDIVHRSWMEDRPWTIYHAPKTISPHRQDLVPTVTSEQNQELPIRFGQHQRLRTGFELTDKRMHRHAIVRETNYCLICHPRGKDSCRTGLKDKQENVQQDALGNMLHGCPLHERISEMNILAREGAFFAALAMICLDNPMCPGTGHRICNDCMKGCIFQKQDPVNIPEIETHCLMTVLQLPFGFELYDLLLRYNPLDMEQPILHRPQNKTIAIVGSGPAGYTLAHYLTRSGCNVLHIDGLKIEPLPIELVGDNEHPPQPVQHIEQLWEDLATRTIGGFGGVAEYGITVRWDKNFLKLIHLSLARRQLYQLADGVRFGGTLTIEDCWRHGVDHIALATGAGKPTIINFQDNLAPGIRTASDFLMGLQLSGAFQPNSTALVQVELPAVVLGGGLTAIDTATELLAYYPIQIEKLLVQCEALGIDHVRANCPKAEQRTLDTMLVHAQALRAEKKKPHGGNVLQLLQSWGGVTVVYRKKMVASPAYRLNHEELLKALEEGIGFLEETIAEKAIRDEQGHVTTLQCRQQNGNVFSLPARSVLMAAGTLPNTNIADETLEQPFQMRQQGGFFQPHRFSNNQLIAAQAEEESVSFFTNVRGPDGQSISFFGDNHPSYAGNVVKAMASAKYGYKAILHACQHVEKQQPAPLTVKDLKEDLTATIVRTNVLQPDILEIVVHAPAAAKHFEPGQFYRLQRYHTFEPKHGAFRLTMEPLALTGAWVDKEKQLLGLVVLQMGLSSRLCSSLKNGEQVVLMGPCGTPTQIPQQEQIVLCGGGLGNAVLISVGKKMRSNGNKIIYFAAYRHRNTLFYQHAIEECADQIIWSVDEGEPITPNPNRPQDVSIRGNIIHAISRMGAMLEAKFTIFPLQQTTRLICVGSDRMMAAIEQARSGVLQPYLGHPLLSIASINSPMQCMMKEICGQCVQRHYDPIRQETRVVFSCKEQDQHADTVDWQNLRDRLHQNQLLEYVTDQWWHQAILPGTETQSCLAIP